MATVSATLKPTTSHLPLPGVSAGDTYALKFNTGSVAGKNGGITVFTDGPNIFGPECSITDATGNVVATSGTGGNSVKIVYNSNGGSGAAKLAPSTDYTLNIPIDGDGGAKYDFQQPQSGHHG